LSIQETSSVAIVGISCIFPDAPDQGSFWENILNARSSSRQVPTGRWGIPADAFFDPEAGARDRVYSRCGCFIDALPSISLLTGLNIDPERIAGLDPLFHLLLHAGKRAFDDGVTVPLDRSRIGVIIGNLVLPSEKSSLITQQWLGRTFTEKLLGHSPCRRETDPMNRYTAGLPAGLLAQALGLGGGSFTLDAACASSIYALKLAVDELLSGRRDAMLTGGISKPDPLYTQMGFSQLRALSARGICSPFDASGDGLVVGEGAGIFLLKRTEDAVAHGDRIYGIIRGLGLSNDVGGSLLAPLSEGQLRAMAAAYSYSGWNPRDVELIECHATGTPVGDATEFASLRELWGDSTPQGDGCVLGSVKSNIGHLLTAAGAAALIKVLLAMEAGILPPTANFSAPPAKIDLENSPFRVLTGAIPWKRRNDGIPRRAAVSAFGFGGINAHLLVEEWLPHSGQAKSIQRSASRDHKVSGITQCGIPIAVIGMDARFGPWQSLRSFRDRVLGGNRSDEPTFPRKWWGADESAWFKGEGGQLTPFKGYYLDEFTVNAGEFRIPPKELEEMLPQQVLMLQVAAAAMADARLGREGNLKAGVFIGITLDMNTTNFSFRWSMTEDAATWARELSPDLTTEELTAWIAALRDAASPPLTANRTMGGLGSIVASRIAREFRFGGPGFTLSSEENSGIRAMETAVRLLQAGELDHALVGAVDLAGDLRAILAHNSIHPLSPSGVGRPFSAEADGAVIGEGATALVLKRLDDANREGDKIYAVIRGIGSSSGATLIPGPDPYHRALERAYADAGVDPSTIGYLEAAASGFPAEDRMEGEALSRFFGSGKRQYALSGVKGEIGHCGAASGLASLVRACLALYQEIIPPCSSPDNPLPGVIDGGPFYLPPTPRFWLRNRADGPRRAGVSSFGMDGGCAHVVLEGWDNRPQRFETERIAPLGTVNEFLFSITAENRAELAKGLDQLARRAGAATGDDLASLSREWYNLHDRRAAKPLALVMVARNLEELAALIEQGRRILENDVNAIAPLDHPSLRDRLFHSPQPIGKDGKIAFVFPGSGNQFPGMGCELSGRWPGLFRRRDMENLHLRGQFQPELFWNGGLLSEMNCDPQAIIFGQVATGCAVSDIVRSFGVEPEAVIGYSLGESAGLFAMDAWRDRDGMLSRMRESTLFTHDMAGECRAAGRAWGCGPGEKVDWAVGVLDAPAQAVRHALGSLSRVYLLIVNTTDECVIGGDARNVERLTAMLGCRFFPIHGVTTVHCEVAAQVAGPYRELHLSETTPPPGVAFYSGAWGRSYEVDRESAANSILAQAIDGIDFPRVIETAFDDGVRLFLEMGPGGSCTRMISRILAGRPHLARSACYAGIEPASAILRLMGWLIAERVPVDLAPLFPPETALILTKDKDSQAGGPIRVDFGGKPFQPPLPVAHTSITFPSYDYIHEDEHATLTVVQNSACKESLPVETGSSYSIDPLLREFASAQDARLKAHESYLRFSDQITAAMGDILARQFSLHESLGDENIIDSCPFPEIAEKIEPAATVPAERKIAFNREMCLEFARGKVSRMLGPAFAEVDTFPTRVRLPDEPLMLVDRIVALEGEARSMTSGRVVTEHDILPGVWYLDAGRIPTCIAVEAGQADLFLSGYLGIDFITRGLAVYRLLDAVVTFHRGLPGAGETIHYDISIERFFQQGDTRFFRFRFDATVDGAPLLTMREGCAGFFTADELAAGRGIVSNSLGLRNRSGSLPADWEELAPMTKEAYDTSQLDRLREGDLAGCFGPLFSGLKLMSPLTIPGGRMRLVHRVMALEPRGGRYGLGLIRAEADIRPDDWFLTCHFTDDRVMPGTLMYECCLHTLRIFLLRMGWLAETAGAAWEPVPDVASRLSCRGQVLETTKIVSYEVHVRELGYRPEPYAVVDALMYADGRAIVEITGMSVRLTGTSKKQLLELWRNRMGEDNYREASQRLSAETCEKKPAIYTKAQILAYSNGNPSEGFGEPYRIFDSERVIARLPGPPYQFMDRITAVQGKPWLMATGALAEAQYDIPPDTWYFAAERQPRMPFAVLLETALQPCGWLAAYAGSALTSPTDLSFRNLGGSAIVHRSITPESGILTSTSTLKKVATSGGMIIQEYDFTVADRIGTLYEGETMFGFFSKEALHNQVGVRDATPYRVSEKEIRRGISRTYPEDRPFPDKMLRMIDRIDLFVPDGGPCGLGYINGSKDVDPDEWFFKAHFYQDPVTPGSLGLESFLQLMKFVAVERWGWREGNTIAVAPGRKHNWLYRGQIIPTDSRVTVEAWITGVDDKERILSADGFLGVDGRLIYRMNDFTVRME